MRGDEENSPSTVIPLRTILRNFLNLVDNCEAGRISGVDTYEREFHELKHYSESLKCDPDYQSKEGEKSVNRKKNRYKDILPFDYTRVVLSDYGEIPGSDYINANFIKGASGSSAYIACQGPLAHTVNDFWRMVVECEVQVVVMACTELESGKHKCENYWVEEDGVEKQFGEVTVWLKKCRNVCPDFLVRTMRIRFPNSKGEMEERNVCQFHYSAWPDHGVPTKVRPLLDMVRLIRDCQTSETLPVLVHCSAGCGRTGTICAIDYVWGLLRLGKLTPDFSLFQLVRDMRRQRIAMVQTKDQYILAHRAVKELFQDQLKIIEAHPYANVDENGLPFDIKKELEEPTYETIEFDGSGAYCLSSAELSGRSDSDSGRKTRTSASASASRSKLKKEVENRREKHKEQPLPVEKFTGSRPPEPIPNSVNKSSSSSSSAAQQEKIECIERSSPSAGEVTKIPPPSSVSPVRSALLRKPSLVKLKAFFDKSPKEDKKSGSTSGSRLSRAKSDVSTSSRFYSFASAFSGSRGHLAAAQSSSDSNNKNNEPILLKTVMTRSESPTKEKRLSAKPPLLTKPSLPVKRSKSLRVHPAEAIPATNPLPSKIPSYKLSNGTAGLDNSKLDGGLHSKSNSTSSNFSSGSLSNSAIKVCVKQVEVPKLQSVVTATTTSLKGDSRTPVLNTHKEEGRSRDEVDFGPDKKPYGLPTPLNPQKDNHNYVNVVSYGHNRIRLGIAKEMEDLSDHETSKRNTTRLGRIKKYDTVNPKSLFGGNGEGVGGTTLTRSQSHVWQPERATLSQLDRIFSDENIHHKSLRVNNPPKTQQLFPENSSARIGGNSQRQINQHSNLSSLVNSKSPFQEDPLSRRRVPKTNPYVNFPSGAERHSPAFFPPAQFRVDDNPSNPGERLMNGNMDAVPQLTGCYNGSGGNGGVRSVGNSSDSSSNAGTPRPSLPSTPTESIDVLYPHLVGRSVKCNGNDGASPKLQRLCYNGGATPKSILKGSLSSTPSESDERLNNISSRPAGHPLSNNNIASQSPLGSMRIGIRERRNSFRQAVWKEAAQSDNVVQENSTSASASQFPPPGNKSHKDYEPIWPDGSYTTSKTFLNISALPERERGSPPMGTTSTTSRSIGLTPYTTTSNSNPTQRQTMDSNNYQGSEGMNGRLNSSSNPSTNAPLQSRMDEIKLLLKELKTPMGVAETNRQHYNNLKYQRSLKAPTRAQYHENTQNGNSLSCFTLKKPSSLESIPDQLHSQNYGESSQDYQPLISTSKSIKTYAPSLLSNSRPPQHLTTPHRGSGSGLHSGNHAQDYVQLCRASDNPRSGFEVECSSEELAALKKTPIPPPRTKAKKFQALLTSIESKDGGDKPGTSGDKANATRSLSLWSGSRSVDEGNSIESKAEDPLPNGSVATASTSPKALIRAIGLFQAKAANVRSKFVNWAEAKERNNHQRRGNPKESTSTTADSSYILRDQGDVQDDDSGFVTSVRRPSNSSQIGATRATKHQYL